MWNPGDEVIYHGVRRLMDAAAGRNVPLLWNRNPAVKPLCQGYDNSFDTGRHDLDIVELCISAGGPEWLGPRVMELYEAALKRELSFLHIGIGLGEFEVKMTPLEKQIFRERSKLVTCRDQRTFDILQGLVPEERLHLRPCPSLFSFMDRYEVKQKESVEIVGINYQSASMAYNNVGNEAFRKCMKIYVAIASKYEVRVICNYVDDYNEAVKVFDPSIVRFSADLIDFVEFFREVDTVIGTRIHGCMGAIACGTPGFLLDSEKDARRRGVREVMEVLDAAPEKPSELLDLLGACCPRELSERNRVYQEMQFREMLELIPKDLTKSPARKLNPLLCKDDADALRVISQLRSTRRSRRFSESMVARFSQLGAVVERIERRLSK